MRDSRFTGIWRGLRVVDFGHYIAGPMTGMLLADQGADVVAVRHPAPKAAFSASATWDRGKRVVELDLREDKGVEAARELIAGADVVIENFRPGTMAQFGLEPSRLLNDHPGLVYCALPGFAPDDPRSELPGYEGVVSAATALYRRSVFDGPGGDPAYTAEPIASSYAAFVAAGAIAAALFERTKTGRGQLVQVPLFDAMYQAIGMVGLRIQQTGGGVHLEPAWDEQYECGDGRWIHIVGNRARAERFIDALGLTGWRADGMADTERLVVDRPLNEDLAHRLRELFRTRSAEEWETLLAGMNFPAGACRSSAEWLDHEHAEGGGLVVPLNDPELGLTRQPAPAVNVIGAPQPLLPRVRIGPNDVGWEPRAAEPLGASRPPAPLAGIRVLDLCIVLAGPISARTLAEAGADVIKIDAPHRDRNSYHLDVNRGKRSIYLDLRKPEGLDVFWQLVETADVVVQNFRTGVVERLGIDYESVRKRKPEIVYGSFTAYGSSGPWAERGGYEETVQALTGMQTRFGSPSRPALLPYAVNDYATGLLAAYALTAALWRRQTTGEGAHIEAALVRTAGMIQSLRLLDYAGKTWDEPTGQAAKGENALYRLYRARDGWFFLAGGRDARKRLQRIPGLEQLGSDGADVEAILERRFLDLTVTEWVSGLRDLGIAAQRANRVSQAMDDPIALAHGLSLERDHDGVGPMRHNASGRWLPDHPAIPGRPTPVMGADAASVLADIGREADLSRLVANGAVRLPA